MVRQKKKASRNLSFNVESDLHNANMSVKHHLDGYSDDDAGGMMDTWSSAIFGGDSFITNLNSNANQRESNSLSENPANLVWINSNNSNNNNDNTDNTKNDNESDDYPFVVNKVSLRQAQKKGKLSNDRLNKLNSIEALKSISDMDIWLEKYYQLKEYLQKNNNVYPIDKSKLGTWISHQRGQFKKGKLNNIRLNYLKEINFIWVGKNISQRKIEENKKIWFENFEKLKNYLRAENNIYPSQKISLGKWVQTQRRKFKEGLLEIDKIEFLNSINFVWIVNKDTQWIEKFEELKIYFKKYGNSLPNHNEFKSLRNWVDRQYYSYKKGTLSDKRFKLLSEIKFDFKRAN